MSINELDCSKLLACPFCGAHLRAEHLELAWDDKTFWIMCRFCGATGPDAYSKEDVLTRWNRRTK